MCREPRVDLIALGARPDLVSSCKDLTPQAIVDLFESPGQCGAVLGPLEVADDHAARVAQDVRDDEDAVGAEDRVGVRADRAIGRLSEDPCPDVPALAAWI